MNSFLLYPEKRLSGETAYPSFQDIYKDLNLNIIIKTMALNDVFIMEQIRSVMMVPVRNETDMQYRYDIIKDFYHTRELLDELYQSGRKGFQMAEQYKKEREQNRGKSTYKTSAIISSLNFIEDSTALLKKIRDTLQSFKGELKSEGLTHFLQRLSGYPLDDFEDFHKKILFFTTGGESIFSIRISGGLKLGSSRLCDCKNNNSGYSTKGTSYKFLKLYYKMIRKDTIMVEGEALDKDINLFLETNMQRITDIYQPFIDSYLTFLFDFAKEIAFYMGVNNMQNRMSELSLPLCYGSVCEDNSCRDIRDLYELSLALYTQSHPVPNSLKHNNKTMTVITGANQGGKSTFLRSFGIAQVMMQCGMPVPAKHFCSGLYSRIHTHFTRKEDAMLTRGRLEEELKRMSGILSEVSKNSLLLLNESFASTTEKEGSQIAYNVILPLYEKGIHVMMVTHLHEFARTLYESGKERIEFLVAERKENGKRTYHMLPGQPHYSSYGTDLYEYMIGKL